MIWPKNSEELMDKLDLGWGEPICVREALNLHFKSTLSPHDLLNMGYPPEAGNEELVNLVGDYLFKTTGKIYQHILITNGATSSLNMVLRSFKYFNTLDTVETYPQYFPYYKKILKKNKIHHTTSFSKVEKHNIYRVIDMPSNALGSMDQSHFCASKTIWDSVYYNPIYINSPKLTLSPHRVNIGSFSKVFGLTGLRIGYIATDSTVDYERFKSEAIYENSGVSTPSQLLATDILKNMDLKEYFKAANAKVNNNREEIYSITHLFDNQEVPNNGMFYGAWGNDKTLEILNKSNVKYVTLDRDKKYAFIRFNLGQNNKITEKAIKAILKTDRRTK